MKNIFFAAILLVSQLTTWSQLRVGNVTTWPPKVDEPAIPIEVPAPYPCNIAPKVAPNSFAVPAVCITGPEIRWTCFDKHRILLTSEDGERHCIDPRLIVSVFAFK